MKVPYTQQFTPKVTPLNRLLPILRSNKGDSAKLKKAIASAFHSSTAQPDKMAGNTMIALRAYGIIDGKGDLTDFGSELVDSQGSKGDIKEAHRILARHLLLKLDGMTIVETLREMSSGGHAIALTTLPDELRKRGFTNVSDNSSDLSGVMGWLRAANVLVGKYNINQMGYFSLIGTSAATLDALKDFNSEQVAFLKSMAALNVQDWTPYMTVVNHAEELYPGEIRYNRKMIVQEILKPLQDAKLIEHRKKEKQDKTTREGRGGKTGDVKPTLLFEKEIAEPLVNALYRAAGFTDIRKIRAMSLAEIVADIEQKDDINKQGKALEWLAIRLCQMLALEFMGWREMDVAVAGGGEADAMLYSSRLVYSRWQIQCKIGKISTEAVMKEVGLHMVSLSNVILVVSTGAATEGAEIYRKKIISSTNLNIIFLDGAALERIIADNSALIEIMRQQAQYAMSVKPDVEGLKTLEPKKDENGNGENGNGSGEVFPAKAEARPASQGRSGRLFAPVYATELGRMFCGDSLEVLPSLIEQGIRAKLIMTSPPFALVRKKTYGNEDADSYVRWFDQFIPLLKQVLEPNGSLVIDIGGAWLKGLPAKSIYQYKLLVKLCESGFYLAQEFYHYNPAKLPTPAEWVTIRRMRVKDAVNNVFWLTLDPFADADNRRVLTEYSDSMKHLLKHGYKAQKRPSGHDISKEFQRDNGGAIPPNLLQFSNTESNSHYLRRCKEEGIKPHPARFPQVLPEFFIKFLTRPGEVVLDFLAGSNVTGAASEKLGRRWISIEKDETYVEASRFRFEPEQPKPSKSRISPAMTDLVPAPSMPLFAASAKAK